jgi:protein TonB
MTNTATMQVMSGGRRGARDGTLVLGALAVSLAIFVALPLLDALAPAPAAHYEVRSVNTLALPPPPPPPPPSAVLAEEPPPRPVPRLEEPPRLVPVVTALALAPPVGNPQGDYAVHFGFTPALDLPGDLVFDVADIDAPPRPIARIPPPYPPTARLRRIEGELVAEFIVTADGAVRDVQIVDAQPPGIFEQTALQTIRRWRFEPGLRDGAPVDVRVRQKLTFRLED